VVRSVAIKKIGIGYDRIGNQTPNQRTMASPQNDKGYKSLKGAPLNVDPANPARSNLSPGGPFGLTARVGVARSRKGKA
jgi:hypothetical protein